MTLVVRRVGAWRASMTRDEARHAEEGTRCDSGTAPQRCVGTKAVFGALGEFRVWEAAASRFVDRFCRLV
ncbi:hypothetical protein EV191_104220 [Tamaricihabitans halophyticus]|uniref:Uncharacterized protein n=1 Tax=Tamaricihabitans halophyticus TaxID=1262583 RepID=A0A4R2R2D5_9PSEU|nr:hypothetical protein EV191_104220 [Tamaricihabitans halophyticus]